MASKAPRVFIDTNVCIDLLAGRMPHNQTAEILFTLADRGKITAYVSALSFPVIDYILKNTYRIKDARNQIAKFKTLVSVLSVDDKIIELALSSTFTDFEDAIQYYCAIENNLNILITRNEKDYKNATINVLSPKSFIALVS